MYKHCSTSQLDLFQSHSGSWLINVWAVYEFIYYISVLYSYMHYDRWEMNMFTSRRRSTPTTPLHQRQPYYNLFTIYTHHVQLYMPCPQLYISNFKHLKCVLYIWLRVQFNINLLTRLLLHTSNPIGIS